MGILIGKETIGKETYWVNVIQRTGGVTRGRITIHRQDHWILMGKKKGRVGLGLGSAPSLHVALGKSPACSEPQFLSAQ